MKNKSVFIRFLMITILVMTNISSRVVAMEEESSIMAEYGYGPNRDKLIAKRQLMTYLSSKDFSDQDMYDREGAVTVVNHWLDKINTKEQVPGENYTFSNLINNVANRYRLTKKDNYYMALPLSISRPRRK